MRGTRERWCDVARQMLKEGDIEAKVVVRSKEKCTVEFFNMNSNKNLY